MEPSRFTNESALTARNRAILLTPPSPGAIAVVRLLGPKVAEFLQTHFSKNPRPGRSVHGTLGDGDRVIDDPVVVLFRDGSGADVNLHGGTWVVRSLLDLAGKEGFEIDRGAAPLAADESLDGDSLLEREVAAAIPAARTELALRALLSQTSAWSDFLATNPLPEDIRRVLADRALHHLLNPPSVAIIGPANAGKSTLANQLFGQERSITADVAGTTRDWVGEIANVDGLPVMLLDTPGIRHTDDAIERAAIEQSGGKVRAADLVVLVLDATRPLEPEQSPLLLAYPDAMKVVNKCDSAWAWKIGELVAIQTIATAGEGVDVLRRSIAAHFEIADIDPNMPRWWTQRQMDWLDDVLKRNGRPL